MKFLWRIVLFGLSLPGVVFAQPGPSPDFVPIGGTGSFIKLPKFFLGGPGPAGRESFGELVVVTLNVVLLVVGSLSVVFLVWGGLRYLTARGNEEAAEAAKKTIGHAILGLTIVILSFAIVAIISRILITGTP